MSNTPYSPTSPLDRILEIGLDKFKFCIPSESVDSYLVESLRAKFDHIEGKPATRKLSLQRRAFRRRLHVKVGGEYVLIECQPNKATYPWAFTAEFNPNPYLRKGEDAIANLGTFFRFLFGHEANRVLPLAVISMLHVNIDYDFKLLEGTLVEVKGKRSGAKVMYNFDGHGVPGSLYVGVLGSDHRLCIYDKAAEVLHRELGPNANRILAALASDKWDIEVSKLREKLDVKERWRLEVRCDPKKAVPVLEIVSFASCVEDVRFLYLPPDDRPFNTSLGRSFIANARNDGINVALQALEPNERRQFDRALTQLPNVEWFNAELLGEAIRHPIAKLAPLFAPPQRHLELAGTRDQRLSAVSASGSATGVKFKRTGSNLAKSRNLVRNGMEKHGHAAAPQPDTVTLE